MDSIAYFDDVAPRWDRLRKGFFSDRVRDVALAKADVRPGKLAADIGAGTGFISEALIEKGAVQPHESQAGVTIYKVKKK